MQQRQLRLGDILDDYCPRERRVTNHAVVAMIGPDVKQTRCTTCDAEHEYKHAKVPRQRRKAETTGALYSKVLASGPKRVAPETPPPNGAERDVPHEHESPAHEPHASEPFTELTATNDIHETEASADHGEPDALVVDAQRVDAPVKNVKNVENVEDVEHDEHDDVDRGEGAAEEIEGSEDEGPVHRPLIRASLPRPEGQPPQSRPMPEFTIRQPGGRPNRFRPRHQRGGGGQQGHHFQGNRSSGNPHGGPQRGGLTRHGGANRPPSAKRHGGAGGGRKRSK